MYFVRAKYISVKIWVCELKRVWTTAENTTKIVNGTVLATGSCQNSAPCNSAVGDSRPRDSSRTAGRIFHEIRQVGLILRKDQERHQDGQEWAMLELNRNCWPWCWWRWWWWWWWWWWFLRMCVSRTTALDTFGSRAHARRKSILYFSPWKASGHYMYCQV